MTFLVNGWLALPVLGLRRWQVFSALDSVHLNGTTGRLFHPEMTGGGVAVVDYDNDGDLDVYPGPTTSG